LQGVNYDNFITLLKDLDEKLEGVGEIDVKAFGGFSILYYSKIFALNAREITFDIDSATEDWPHEVEEIIFDIAEEHDNIDYDWLNNSWVRRQDFKDELLNKTEWGKVGIGLKNINLYIADIESLFKLKLRAISDKITNGEKPRAKDVMDLESILNVLGEDIANLSRSELSEYAKEHPDAMSFLLE